MVKITDLGGIGILCRDGPKSVLQFIEKLATLPLHKDRLRLENDRLETENATARITLMRDILQVCQEYGYTRAEILEILRLWGTSKSILPALPVNDLRDENKAAGCDSCRSQTHDREVIDTDQEN